MQDFLQRCLESPFSRKLDLWSFLDIPRSRLVKYPLLLKEILKHTPADHPDAASLEEAVSLPRISDFSQSATTGDEPVCPCVQITIIQGVLSDINMKKGESECRYYIDQLEYLDERQRDARIEQCRSLLCHGELRNKSGTVSTSHTHRYTHTFSFSHSSTFLFPLPLRSCTCSCSPSCWF